MSKHKRTIFFDSLHDKSIVFQINDENRKEIIQELLGSKYLLEYDKKGKLQLNFKNY